jgi:hypothetical protein
MTSARTPKHVKMADTIFLRDSTEGKVSTPMAFGWRQTRTTIITPCAYPSWTALTFVQLLLSSFAQLDISARQLNRDAKQESAPVELVAQFAANWRASTLEPWQAARASWAANMASSSAEYFLAAAVALCARYGVAARGCTRARSWGA